MLTDYPARCTRWPSWLLDSCESCVVWFDKSCESFRILWRRGVSLILSILIGLSRGTSLVSCSDRVHPQKWKYRTIRSPLKRYGRGSRSLSPRWSEHLKKKESLWNSVPRAGLSHAESSDISLARKYSNKIVGICSEYNKPGYVPWFCHLCFLQSKLNFVSFNNSFTPSTVLGTLKFCIKFSKWKYESIVCYFR